MDWKPGARLVKPNPENLLGVWLIPLVEARGWRGEARPASVGGRVDRWIGVLLAVVALINVGATFLECGLGPCPDNPTDYWLLEGKP